jgi:CheY-like chemotaxis protein
LAKGSKLLLADDSVTVQKVVDLTFSDEGIEVVAVSDGEQALAKLQEFTPDVILADIHMPKVSGYAVCEYVKRHERFQNIPVMLLVGSFEPFDEAEARRVGADDFLTKPFQSIRQLVSKVGTLLGKESQTEEPTSELSPVTAMPRSHTSGEVATEDLEVTTADTQPLPELPREKSFTKIADLREQSFADIAFEDESAEAPKKTEPQQHEERAQPATMSTFDPTPEPFQAFAPEGVEASSLSFATQSSSQGSGLNYAAAADDALLDIGEIEPPSSAVEADDFILDLQDEIHPPMRTATFVEPSVLEVSAVDFSTDYVEASEPVLSEQVSATPGYASSLATGLVTGSELSPEAIDAIARRVVELMSTQMIEQIAWEVVPQLSEMLVKQQLENDKSRTR